MPGTNYTTNLRLANPSLNDTGWGTTVSNGMIDLTDQAIAGTTTLSADTNVTLTTANGAADQSRQMILNCTGARTAQRTITAPASSKVYVVINNTTGGYGVKIAGPGPTSGVVVPNGHTLLVAWNGSDFVANMLNGPGYQSGLNIVPYGATQPLASLTFSLTNSLIYYVLFYIHSPVTLTSVALNVTTAQSGSSVRLGLYNVVAAKPSDKIAEYGTVSSDTTGVKTITISSVLQPGYYYLALCSDTNAVQIRASSVLPVLTGALIGTLVPLNSAQVALTETTLGTTLPSFANPTGYIGVSVTNAGTTSSVPGVYFFTA